jgi:hypothetical protein
MRNIPAAVLAIVLLAGSTLSMGAKPPDTWDGLLRVDSKNLDGVYLEPGADFRGYTKVLLDPVEVAFRMNWQRDQNRESLDLTTHVSDEDARKILNEARTGFDKLFADAYTKAGYQVVTVPGPDVLKVSTAIANLDVVAPEDNYPGISRTYSREAGQATLAIEARDSISGELLGRAVDQRDTGDFGPYIRNSVTHIADFRQMFQKWADISVKGLGELKQLSPIDPDGMRK